LGKLAVAAAVVATALVGAGTPAGSADGHPAKFIAALDGGIAVVSADTGRVDRWLVGDQPGGRAKDPSLSPDGRTVWFSRSDGSCTARLASIPLAGGREQALPGSGEAGPEGTPLLRPGGRHIAYSRTGCNEPDPALIIGDLDGLQGRGQTGLVPLAWSRDGTLLLASAAAGDEARLLEVSEDGAIVGIHHLAPVDQTEGCRLRVVGFSPDDNNGYVALRRCGVGESTRATLVLLDQRGAYRRSVVRLPRGEDFADRPAFDQTGHSLLFASAPAPQAGSAEAYDDTPEASLWLWRDGETRVLARRSSYRQPSWLS
jgi:hypothetical protein